MSVIAHIGTALPQNEYRQTELADFMADLFQYEEPQKRKLHALYAKSGIETRYSVISDYTATIEEREFFPKTRNLAPFPNLEHRMHFFNKTAPELCIKAIEDCIDEKSYKKITHLITVTCTGLSAPGLDIEIMQRLKLNENLHRTSINFMGCYAAIHALKQADYICRSDSKAMVLVVCVELCSLHFQKIDDVDNITANLLFADGAAAAIVVPGTNKTEGLQMDNFYSHVSLKGKGDMAWQLSSHGFLMTLSSYIPDLIQGGIKAFFAEAIKQLSVEKEDIRHWAVHPGGRKVLDVVKEELQLQPEHLHSSYKTLKDHGNMSSPTILFVLKDIIENRAEEGDRTFCVAFGPGLTMESVIMQNV